MATPRQSLELTTRGRVVLALAATSLLGAWLSGDGNVRLAAALLAAPLAVDYARKPRGLATIRGHMPPRRTVVGALFRDQLTLQNGINRPVRELLVTEASTLGEPSFVTALPMGGRVVAWITGKSSKRGHLLERVFLLQSEWPLGLIRASATVVVATDLVTEPRRVRLTGELLHAAAELQPSPHTRSHLAGDEFHALREHQADDDARGVHALRSAAMGHLVRTVRRGRLPHHLAIVLDLRRPPGRPLHQGRNRFEWSLGACAALLDRLCADAATVHLFVVGSRTVHADVQAGRRLRETLTLLAEVTAGPHRQLEPSVLDDLRAMEHSFWIPAGGYAARTERALLGQRVQMLGGGIEE